MSITTGKPAWSDSDCTLIIPAYNEEKRIGEILAGMVGTAGHYLVICDGSDATADLVNRFAVSYPSLDIRCISFGHRLGKGGAVREGFSRVMTPLAGYLDADGSASISQVHHLIRGLDGADGVIGSRWLRGSVIPEPQGIARRLESRAFNLIIRVLFGLGFSDTQCGAKVFKKSAIDAVLNDMVSTGFEFDVELLWRLSLGGFSIRECPIEWHNRGDSRVKGSDVMGMLRGLVSLRLCRGL